MTRRTLGAAGILWLALTAAAMAQGAEDAVLLRYHFQPGQEFRYRMTLTGDMPMTMGGMAVPAGANMPGKIPVTMNGTYEFVQKVKSVSPDGAAIVSFGMAKMDLTMGMMGMNIVSRLGAGRKLETMMNGQPMVIPNAPNGSVPDPLFEGTIDATGKLSGMNADSLKSMNQLFGGQNLASLFNGMPGTGGLILPAKPIKPGETWDTKYDLKVPVAMPGAAGAMPGGGPGSSLPLSFTVHNKLVKVEEGRAVIETQTTASAPPGAKMALPNTPGAPPGMSMTIEKLDQSMTGTLRFQIEQGTMEGGDYDARVVMMMALGLPPGLGAAPAPGAGAKPGPKKAGSAPQAQGSKPGAAAAPPTLKISTDGTIKMKIDRVTAAPAAPVAQ